jgi:hypothetical protein
MEGACISVGSPVSISGYRVTHQGALFRASTVWPALEMNLIPQLLSVVSYGEAFIEIQTPLGAVAQIESVVPFYSMWSKMGIII